MVPQARRKSWGPELLGNRTEASEKEMMRKLGDPKRVLEAAAP